MGNQSIFISPIGHRGYLPRYVIVCLFSLLLLAGLRGQGGVPIFPVQLSSTKHLQVLQFVAHDTALQREINKELSKQTGKWTFSNLGNKYIGEYYFLKPTGPHKKIMFLYSIAGKKMDPSKDTYQWQVTSTYSIPKKTLAIATVKQHKFFLETLTQCESAYRQVFSSGGHFSGFKTASTSKQPGSIFYIRADYWITGPANMYFVGALLPTGQFGPIQVY